MYCCSNCFNDYEVKTVLENNATEIDVCNFCNSENVKVIDCREFAEFFQPVIDLYVVDNKSNKLLVELIQEDWNVFAIDISKAQKLLDNMFVNEPVKKSGLFSKKVSNRYETSNLSQLQLNQWEEFKNEIKLNNRFFIKKLIELDLLLELIKDQVHIYKSGKYFYRGRITDEKGVSKEKIGKPPVELASPGRANPKGIPYLYISADVKTTLYETRATYLDYVTIGTFKLIKDIKIIRLRDVKNKSPFRIQNLEKYVFYKNFLFELEKELSKPLRRFDSELDYIPSQYICEFIKSNGYDGVEYGSSLNKNGINLAIFDDSKLKCIDTKIVEIKNIEITF